MISRPTQKNVARHSRRAARYVARYHRAAAQRHERRRAHYRTAAPDVAQSHRGSVSCLYQIDDSRCALLYSQSHADPLMSCGSAKPQAQPLSRIEPAILATDPAPFRPIQMEWQ
jgi:hypothetical protein